MINPTHIARISSPPQSPPIVLYRYSMQTILLVLTALLYGCGTKELSTKHNIVLEADEVVLIGYGSLTSKESMERTLGREYTGQFMTTHLANWRREWTAAMPNHSDFIRFYTILDGDTIAPRNILYLNIRRTPGDTINTCLFIIDTTALRLFDEREWIYDRVDVTGDLIGITVTGGKAYGYTAKPQYTWIGTSDVNEVAIRKSYIGILHNAFEDLDPNFKKEFEASTESFSTIQVIEDRTLNTK